MFYKSTKGAICALFAFINGLKHPKGAFYMFAKTDVQN